MKYYIPEAEYVAMLAKFPSEISRAEWGLYRFEEKRTVFFTDTVLCLLCVRGEVRGREHVPEKFWIEMETCGLTVP